MNKILDHWEIFAGSIASIFAYIRGRKVKRLDEISKLQEIYNKLFDDMNDKYEQMKVEIKRLNDKIEHLELENAQLKKKLRNAN